MKTARVAALMIGIFAAVVIACSNDADRACYRGEYLACTCAASGTQAPGGAAKAGYAVCLESEMGYGPCDCSGAVPGLEAGAPVDAGQDAASDGGKLAFMQPCERNEQCETGLCFPFNAKGPHCSKKCKSDGDCPSPSPGCNNMGACKAP